MILLYLGPEVVAPVLSVLAAIGGVLMMFWRRVVAVFRAATRLVTGKSIAPPPGEGADRAESELSRSDTPSR